ncbi:hypothetical protein VPH35_121804 [Triticum aestivum]
MKMARALFIAVLATCFVALGLPGEAAAERKTVGVYELNKGDFSIKVTNWGATLMSVILPDSRGNLGDVILGYDTVAEYMNGTAYFGGLIGRVANRIANARFTLDGKVYRLVPNDGNNTLHGGHRGFDKVVWTVKEHVAGGSSPFITLYYHSFDGEQGASMGTTSTTSWTAGACGGWRPSGTARPAGQWSCGRTSLGCSSTRPTG